MAENDDDEFSGFVDFGLVPGHVDSLVEAILSGDRERAIDLLCEAYPDLVSYQHQAARHSVIAAGRKAAA